MSSLTAQIPISIAIKGHCHEYFPQIPEQFDHEVDEGQSMRQILEGLGIKPQLIMGVLVNGKIQKKEYQPASGDRIILLSPPTGG